MESRSERFSESWLWILGLFSVASFVETVYFGQLGAFTPLYLPRLGVPELAVAEWTGRVAAIGGIIGIPFLPFWGALADRYKRQPVIVRSFVAHLLSSVVMLLSPNVWVFAVGRAISGLALGNSGLMLTTLSERTPRGRLGLAFSILSSMGPIGAFIGPLIGGPIVDRWGFTLLLGIDGLLMLAIILSMTFGYQDSFKGTGSGSVFRMAWDSLVIVARSPLVVTVFLAMILLFGGWMLVFTYIPVIVKSIYQGNSPAQAVGLVMGLGGLTSLIIGPLTGALSDRFGSWRILFIGAGLAVILWPLPMLTRDLTLFTALWSLVNGVTSGVFAVSFTVLSGAAEERVRGRVMSFSYLPINIGSTIGPAIGSLLATWNIFLMFPAAAILTLMGLGVLVAAARLAREAPKPQAADAAAR